MKPIPIGYEDFKEILDKGCYYIDKTLFIKDLLDFRAKVQLYTRPRRFGKTLNMSMLQQFFEKTEESNAYLFEGLNIAKAGSEYMQHQGQYPVITLSLKSMKQGNYELAFDEFKRLIQREFLRHESILHSPKIADSLRESFKEIYDNKAADKDYKTAIRFLSDCLYAAHGQKVVILIDEYDVPLQAAYQYGFYDEMVMLIRSVFESALKTNPYLELGVLTGCLRVSKESIFTGLNNLNVYSIGEVQFARYFGFTEDEVRKITEDFGIADHFDIIKEWYGGYLFGETEIYNPWSVLKYVDAAICTTNLVPRAYWANTSSNDIIHDMIVDGSHETHTLLEKLASGETITKPIYEDVTYRNINVRNDTIWSFLLYTGYLKAIRIFQGDADMPHAELILPNKEVRMIYRTTIMDWTKEKISADSRTDLFEAVINGNVEAFEDILCDWLENTLSYYDEKEMYYHGFLAGLLGGFKGYETKSNRESGEGRPDILLLELRRRKLAVIIEVKIAKDFIELEQECDSALRQIEEKQYEAGLKAGRYQSIIKYGVAFYDKTCRIKKA